MVQHFDISLPAHPRGFHLITEAVLGALPPLPESGVLTLFIQHTSAGLSVNENADASVRRDLDKSFDRLAPEDAVYEHDDEGSDDMPAHVKSVLAGSSVTIPVTNGRLKLGRWQGIYLCEFRDHATPRKLVASVIT